MIRNSILLIFLALAACSAPAVPPSQTPTPAATLPLVMYSTPTPTLTPLFITPTHTRTPLPTLTPTPFLYQVKDGEVMGIIAFRFGITVEELMRANPDVNPYAIGPNTTLIIPVRTPTPDPAGVTPTPLPVQVSEPACYPTLAGGVRCLVLVTNTRTAAVDNLTGTITLIAQDASLQVTQPLSAPLNRVEPGASLPLAAEFNPPVPSQWVATAQLNSVFFLTPEDTRYLLAALSPPQVSIAPDGLSAAVTGFVNLAGQQDARLVWVVAVAYDASGAPVGYRKWEAQQVATPGKPLPFTFNLYALGSTIERVELLVEARP